MFSIVYAQIYTFIFSMIKLSTCAIYLYILIKNNLIYDFIRTMLFLFSGIIQEIKIMTRLLVVRIFN